MKVVVAAQLWMKRKDLPRLCSMTGMDQSRLAVRRKFDGEPLPLVEVVGDYVGVPRHFFNLQSIARHPEVELIDQRVRGNRVSFESRSVLDPGQRQMFDGVVRSVAAGGTGFLLHAPPGFGKTVLLLSILAELKVLALVIVPRSALVNQWVDRIVQHTSLKRSEIGLVMSGKADVVQKKIVIGLVHSVSLDRWPSFGKMFGAVVFDEVHAAVPPATFSPVLSNTNSLYRIGASATLERPDGAHVVFDYGVAEYLFAPSRQHQNKRRIKAEVVVVQYRRGRPMIVPPYLKTANQRRGWLLTQFGKDAARNRLIIDLVVRGRRSGYNVLILSDRTLQLYWVWEALKHQVSVGGLEADVGVVADKVQKPEGGHVSVPSEERERAVAESNIILATNGAFKLGMDVPSLSMLILATPIVNEIDQSIGRIERYAPGKKTPRVFDLVDVRSRDAERWFLSRKRIYERKGYALKTVTV